MTQLHCQNLSAATVAAGSTALTAAYHRVRHHPRSRFHHRKCPQGFGLRHFCETRPEEAILSERRNGSGMRGVERTELRYSDVIDSAHRYLNRGRRHHGHLPIYLLANYVYKLIRVDL